MKQFIQVRFLGIMTEIITEGLALHITLFKRMKAILAMVLLSIYSVHSLKLSQHLNNNEDIMVGGYSALDVNNLSEDAKAVDEYLKSLHPDLKSASLYSAQRQVVAGFNYHYKYRSADAKKEWDIVVYKNIKGNLYENGYTFTETLPNGQKVTAIADPASAFTPNQPDQPVRASPNGKVGAAPTSPQKTSEASSSQPSSNGSGSPAVIAYRDVFPNAVSPTVIK